MTPARDSAELSCVMCGHDTVIKTVVMYGAPMKERLHCHTCGYTWEREVR